MAASAVGAAASATAAAAPAGIAVLSSEIDSLLKSKFGKLVRAVYSSFSGRSDSDLYDDLVLCVTIYESRLPELVTSDETNKDKKHAKTPYTMEGEKVAQHLETRFKLALPRKPRTWSRHRDR